MKSETAGSETRFWRVHCHIGHHPGQWQYWFREQCCAVGWAPPEYQLDSPGGGDRAWSRARNALGRMRLGDWIVASLPGWRIGALGRIVELRIADSQWDPIIPGRKGIPLGENGRRILVRWDLTLGPEELSKVVLLPAHVRPNSGQMRATVGELPMDLLEPMRVAMRDEANWTSLIGQFSMETTLSDYIALHPHDLEAGMISHPSLQARELTFGDRTRADVILQDRNERTVIVECKQSAPSLQDLAQVCRYRDHLVKFRSDVGEPRMMLVHGGSRRVSPEVAALASERKIDLVHHELQVVFSTSMWHPR